jgi:hypothetical protein
MTSTFVELPLSLIRYSPIHGQEEGGYQRPLNIGRAALMADNWSDELYQPLDVAQAEEHPDGTTYEAVNGNHRLYALRILASRQEEDPEVHVHLHNGGAYTTPQERAALFRRCNSRNLAGRTTVPLTARQDFIAGVIEGDAECLDILQVLTRHDLDVQATAGIQGVAITALQALYRRKVHGGKWLLEETFAVLTGAWPDPSQERHLGHLIAGLGGFIRQAKVQHRYRRKASIAALDAWTPSSVILQARERQSTMQRGYNTEALWASIFRDIILPDLEVDGWVR